MYSFHVLAEKDTDKYYICAFKQYNGYEGSVEYGAAITDWDTLEDLEDIECKDETEAITEWAKLVEKYR